MKHSGMSGHERPYRGATDSWLTPKDITDALGPFDLDPCAADPRPFDIATVNFTEADDGLSKDWGGACMVQSAIRPARWLVARTHG